MCDFDENEIGNCPQGRMRIGMRMEKKRKERYTYVTVGLVGIRVTHNPSAPLIDRHQPSLASNSLLQLERLTSDSLLGTLDLTFLFIARFVLGG